MSVNKMDSLVEKKITNTIFLKVFHAYIVKLVECDAKMFNFIIKMCKFAAL